ncbi:porin family protein [Telluribacter sp. SYSU D00476]|uniref:porin family protein n=1 Tax=Telluribacter sp. SYSU D00476 TaxID=2811430 RepID=UPI001FF0ED74|nr:porin family protein [Telluribacter sp. SYSU D00476]
MKKIYLSLLFAFVSTLTWAQDQPIRHTFAVEVDPIAYLLKGYSVHGIYQPGRWAFDLGVYGIGVPEAFHGNEGFDVKQQGYGLKANYSFRKSGAGLFAGIGGGNGTTKAKHRESGAEDTGHSWSVGPQVGYRFFFKKPKDGQARGLYITPWASVDYQFQNDKVKFSNLDFKEGRFTPFATIHLGYRF